MALRLENKNALITGGASGIGRATAVRFAEEGANVFVADRHLAAAEETAQMVRKLGRKAVAHQVDASDEAQVDAMVERMVKELGGVDILLAAAGISHARYGEDGQPAFAPLSDKPFEHWKKVLSVNLDGVFLTDRAVARAMIKAGKGGRIINIASGAAKLPTPGFINTPMTAGIQLQGQGFMERLFERVPLKKMGEPVDVANTALFLASEEGRYYTGSILHPDGGVVLQ
jgi:NAD(P)-dependent dehydrogenase (short-subunit alcohol dehydrogenase family)